MDRKNSLSLGHAPVLQDYDIDTPMMKTSDEYPSEIVALMRPWVECARIQGKIFSQLYAPAASSLAPEERARIAEGLADELERINERKLEVRMLPSGFTSLLPDLSCSGILGYHATL